MKIAITGGTGFIGKSLSKKFIENGQEVRILTRKKPGTLLKTEYAEVDYLNGNSLADALKGQDIVIHLAAALFCRSKKAFFTANAESTKNIVSAANKTGIKKIVYISSLAAGGPAPEPGRPRTEKDPDSPVSYYGKSKLAAEKELSAFKGQILILRPPIVYGPKDSGFSKIAEWVKKGIMVVPGSKETAFSFIYLEDLVKCIMKASQDISLNEVSRFYVCENRTYKWAEFIEEMSLKMKVKKPAMINMPAKALYAAGLAYEIVSYLTSSEPVLNRDKAREASAGEWTCSSSNWEEKASFKEWTPLKEGLAKTFAED